MGDVTSEMRSSRPRLAAASVDIETTRLKEGSFGSTIKVTRDRPGTASFKSAYSVVGTGDYTGSGTDDILYRDNTTGDTGFYQIVNGVNMGWHDLGASSTAYHVVS